MQQLLDALEKFIEIKLKRDMVSDCNDDEDFLVELDEKVKSEKEKLGEIIKQKLVVQ